MAQSRQCINCDSSVYRKPSFWKRLKGTACCSKKCRGEYLKTAYLGRNNPNSYNKDVIQTFFHNKFMAIKHTAEQRQIEFTLTEQDLLDQFNLQNGLCYYSSIPLQFKTTLEWNTKLQADLDVMSLDRKNSALGYTKKNVVWCCNALNKSKGNASEQEFKNFLSHILLIKQAPLDIKCKKVRKTALLPIKAKLGDAGYDLTIASIEEDEKTVRVFSGLAFECPPGVYLQIYPRSSIYKLGLYLTNSVGIIDNQYRGEVQAIFYKTEGCNTLRLKVGDRFAQIVPSEYKVTSFDEVTELSETERGEGGFGSTKGF